MVIKPSGFGVSRPITTNCSTWSKLRTWNSRSLIKCNRFAKWIYLKINGWSIPVTMASPVVVKAYFRQALVKRSLATLKGSWSWPTLLMSMTASFSFITTDASANPLSLKSNLKNLQWARCSWRLADKMMVLQMRALRIDISVRLYLFKSTRYGAHIV